jgi:ribose 5-phosphate isomerase A
VKWKSKIATELRWSGPISNRVAKEEVAKEIAEKVADGDIVGVGSGSTSFLAIQALGVRIAKEEIRCTAIPTSLEAELACTSLGIPTTTLLSARPNWCFDGADEVDPQGNIIKGRGGAMFRGSMSWWTSQRWSILSENASPSLLKCTLLLVTTWRIL